MSNLVQPSIILLKEGTDDSQGIPQLLSNISACIAVVDCVKSTLGPRGMDKLIQGDRDITISNDGATIMALLDIVHPAAKTLVDIAKSQDSEVGDGTTSVVVLTGAFLNAAKPFIEDGVHPQIVRKFFRQALDMSIQFIESYAITYGATGDDKRTVLEKLAGTAMNSKLISAYKAFFAPMVVDAVMCLDEHLPIEMIGIKEVKGGAVQDSLLVKGVAFEKTFSYAGFEQQPKKIMNPKIVLLNMELELKSEKENAEVRISDPAEYQKIVDAEWSIIYDKLDKIVKSGATVVLSRLAIGDLATQYFADRDVFCAGRVPEEDLVRMAKACGGQVQTTVNDLHDEHLGTCGVLEEKQIGGKRFNVFTECPKSKTATIVLRGGAEQFIAESHRSLHDAIMIVRRAMKHDTIVPGGGAIEMALSKHLREHARTIRGKGQLIINEYAKALEVIPRTITENAGLDPTDVLNKLRQKHHAGEKYTGVDVNAGGVCNAYEALVWEPALIRTNALKAATEAAAVVLSVDETIRHPKSERDPEPSNPYPQRARPGGRR